MKSARQADGVVGQAPNELKREIQTALVELRACEAALHQGEASLAHDVICKTIARLGRLLHDDTESRDR